MSEKEVYAIMNLENYAAHERKRAALSIAKECGDNLDEFVSINQVCLMIEELSIGVDEEERILLDEEGRESLHFALKSRLYNMALAKLAAAGKLECAWDEEENQMVFWSPLKQGSPDAPSPPAES